MMGNALVGFGANLGEPEQKYLSVISRLHAYPGIGVMGAGRLFHTCPIGGPPDQPSFQNGGIRLDVSISPIEVFSALQQIESSLGRKRGDYWGPREIDLDLLLYSDLQNPVCTSSDALTLPHPRFHYRRFALAPANEVAPDMLHPTFGLTVAELLEGLDRTPRIVAVASDDQLKAGEFASQIAERARAPFIERSLSAHVQSSDEWVTVYDDSIGMPWAPQLVIWLSCAASKSTMPTALQNQLKATKFSTWLSLDAANIEAALVEGAAAIAAMRPFAKQ